MNHPSYLKLTRELRQFADRIEANCGQKTPQQKRILTITLNSARRATRIAQCRHNGWTYRPREDE
jgi:hypothetical protein